MLATLYTDVPLPSRGMRSAIHRKDPQKVLADNLSAALKARKLSVRAIEAALKKNGLHISNRTIQNMVNGSGNVQFDNLLAVSAYVRIPLWQLLCPGMEISHLSDVSVHELLEAYSGLSEIGRKGALKHVKGQLLLEKSERAPPSSDSSETENAT